MTSLKRILILVALLPVSLPLLSQQLRLEKPDGVYGIGETVRVWAGDSLCFEESFDKPVARSLGDIGFIVAPEAFTPGFTEPDDFRSWWDGQIAAMRALPMEAKVAQVPSKDPSINVYSLEIPMHEGNPVRGYFGIPKDAAPGSLPIYFYAHAAGNVRKEGTHASPDREVISFARKGAISIDINAHGMLNDAAPEYYAKLDTTEVLMYQDRPVRDRESYYFRLMFLRMVRALDYMCTRPEWDGKRVMVQGESQGGAQSFALAGLDPRVGAVVAIVPAMTDLGGSLQDRASAWPYNLRPMVPLSSHGRSVLPYFDGALFLKYFTGKLYVEAGLVDKVCPPAGVVAGFNNSGATQKEIHFYPWRGHSNWTCDQKEDWEKTILPYRERFIEEYLK